MSKVDKYLLGFLKVSINNELMLAKYIKQRIKIPNSCKLSDKQVVLRQTTLHFSCFNSSPQMGQTLCLVFS